MNLDLAWSDTQDDNTVIGIAKGIIDKAVALGKVDWSHICPLRIALTNAELLFSSLANFIIGIFTRIMHTSIKTSSAATVRRIKRNCRSSSEGTTQKDFSRGYNQVTSKSRRKPRVLQSRRCRRRNSKHLGVQRSCVHQGF